MTQAVTGRCVEDPDGVYQKLIDLHSGLTESQSHVVNARLILLLINEVADEARVSEAIRAAAGTLVVRPPCERPSA